MKFNTKIAIAVDPHPTMKEKYTIWYIEVGMTGRVKHVGSIAKDDLIESLFKQYHLSGETTWRVFRKEAEKSTPIEITDFMAMNINENTHFGNLPHLEEFQKTLEVLQFNMEIKKSA